jgi:amidase
MTSDGPIWQWSAHEVVAAIRAGDLSSVDAVSSVVERMRATNGRVNAVTVDLGDEAVAKARETDRVVASGVSLGALHGVPVTIKENVDQKGQATPNGLVSLKDLVAPDDPPVARNLRAAGAIIIGRTNTPEMSLRAFTSNPLRGATVNP